MREVKVMRDELLAKVRENRKKHIEEFKEACLGYKDAALDRIEEITSELRQKVSSLKEGNVIELMAVSFNLDVPRSYQKAYDQVIEMLEMSVEDTLTLNSVEFGCYVMDDWTWKSDFLSNTSRYTNKM